MVNVPTRKPKPWRSYEELITILVDDRGLLVDDPDVLLELLRSVGYYRLSGYFRYFQVKPTQGLNRFMDGTCLDDIREMYELDQLFHELLRTPLSQFEVFLRAQYAHVVGEVIEADPLMPKHVYLQERFYPGNYGQQRPLNIVEGCLSDINRSREPFILHRIDKSTNDYVDLPVWNAVEAFSFGSLSKCIEYACDGELADRIAELNNIPRGAFSSRVRSLVYLRNRWAHHARLWNHSVLDAAAVPNNVRGKAKRKFGQFGPRSIMDVVVSLDDLMRRTGIDKSDLDNGFAATVASEFAGNDRYWRGLTNPLGPDDFCP